MSDHILSLLQGELSRETGAELHSLSSGLAELHDTLCGNVVRFAHTVASYDPSHRCRQPANLPLFRLPWFVSHHSKFTHKLRWIHDANLSL